MPLLVWKLKENFDLFGLPHFVCDNRYTTKSQLPTLNSYYGTYSIELANMHAYTHPLSLNFLFLFFPLFFLLGG